MRRQGALAGLFLQDLMLGMILNSRDASMIFEST